MMDEMENYKPEKMPYVVQYQLAMSIIENETLTDEQRKKIYKKNNHITNR